MSVSKSKLNYSLWVGYRKQLRLMLPYLMYYFLSRCCRRVQTNAIVCGLFQLCPKFLHTNSTSHTWPFSAIAELIGMWINSLPEYLIVIVFSCYKTFFFQVRERVNPVATIQNHTTYFLVQSD